MNTNLLYQEEIAVSHAPRPTGNPLADEVLEEERKENKSCSKCGGDSSFSGETCPACGESADKKLTDDKKFGLGFLAVVFVLAMIFVFYLYKKGLFKRNF
jgi:hypothetical protein